MHQDIDAVEVQHHLGGYYEEGVTREEGDDREQRDQLWVDVMA